MSYFYCLRKFVVVRRCCRIPSRPPILNLITRQYQSKCHWTVSKAAILFQTP